MLALPIKYVKDAASATPPLHSHTGVCAFAPSPVASGELVIITLRTDEATPTNRRGKRGWKNNAKPGFHGMTLIERCSSD